MGLVLVMLREKVGCSGVRVGFCVGCWMMVRGMRGCGLVWRSFGVGVGLW